MRVLHLCKMDSGGGAADGFLRIHRALLAEGVDSVALVMKKRRQAPAVIDVSATLSPGVKAAWQVRRLTAKLARLGRRSQGVFDFDSEGVFPVGAIIDLARDIHGRWDAVIVHWSGGYLRPESVAQIAQALGAKVGLWQVDMAHMTGGCHYSLQCLGYQTGCGRCPALASTDEDDVSSLQARHRRAIWAKLDAVVLAQSSWSARKAAASNVLAGLRQTVLPIPLELKRMPASGDKAAARHKLGLPGDGRRMALVRTTDPSIAYKGFAVLKEALGLLDQTDVPLHLIGVGSRGLFPDSYRHITFTDLGHLDGDEAMLTAYQASDFFVCPSIDDAGPMMVPEAMAAGRPVVASPVGIANDLIVEGVNGTLCGQPGDAASLAAGMRRYAELSDHDIRLQGEAATSVRDKLTSRVFADRLREVFL